MEKHCILLHPPQIKQAGLDILYRQTYGLMMEKLKENNKLHVEINLIHARRDRNVMMNGSKDWDKWIDSVVRRYHYAFVTETLQGRARAEIIRKMLERGRKVLFQAGNQFLPVKGIITIDEKDWKAGWMIQL